MKDWKNCEARFVDLDQVAKAVVPNSSVRCSPWAIIICIPGRKQVTEESSEGWLRMLLWLMLPLFLPVMFAAERMHIAPFGVMWCATGTLFSIVGWILVGRIEEEFQAGVKETLARAKSETSKELLLIATLVAYWRIRDTRPWFASYKNYLRQWRSRQNSIDQAMLEPLRTAFIELEGLPEEREKWVKLNFYDQAISGVQSHVESLAKMWMRSVAIPRYILWVLGRVCATFLVLLLLRPIVELLA